VQKVHSDSTNHIPTLLIFLDISRTFYVDEPLNDAVQLWSEDSPCVELDEYCTHSLLEGLSFKAVDKHGNIVGVTISGVIPLNEVSLYNRSIFSCVGLLLPVCPCGVCGSK
jgi:hypothetical protein